MKTIGNIAVNLTTLNYVYLYVYSFVFLDYEVMQKKQEP